MFVFVEINFTKLGTSFEFSNLSDRVRLYLKPIMDVC